MCREGHLIDTIRSLRERYQITLKDAKSLVDEFRDSEGLLLPK